jgi:gluconokinase
LETPQNNLVAELGGHWTVFLLVSDHLENRKHKSSQEQRVKLYNYAMGTRKPRAIILMGVSGCGKTSVGKALSTALCWPFFDGDDFHPEENIAKMSQGIPLDDADRQPWLENLNQLVADHLMEESPLIVACSALKQRYREILQGADNDLVFVYLEGSFNLIYARIQQRESHYMKAEMLLSQFQSLEEPQNAITVNIQKDVPEIVAEIIAKLNFQSNDSR